MKTNKTQLNSLINAHSQSIGDLSPCVSDKERAYAILVIKSTGLKLIEGLNNGLTKPALELELSAERLLDRSTKLIDKFSFIFKKHFPQQQA
jgi:hypothetical protein